MAGSAERPLGPVILAIETSCDETGAGLVRGHDLVGESVASSVDEHARFGGVVPEVASRAHLEAMVPAVDRALAILRLFSMQRAELELLEISQRLWLAKSTCHRLLATLEQKDQQLHGLSLELDPLSEPPQFVASQVDFDFADTLI